MDADLDDALEAEARRTHTSKAALIRSRVASKSQGLPAVADDPPTELLGISDVDPLDDIDAVIYER